MNRYIYILSLFVGVFFLSSCDEHEAVAAVDMYYHPGYIVCDDGEVYSSVEELKESNSKAFAVICSELLDDTRYLAVLLTEQEDLAFCTAYTSTGASYDISAYNGFSNTVAMQSVNSIDSTSVPGIKLKIECPVALNAFNSHAVGQSDFLPSVAELRMLYSNKYVVNKTLSSLAQEGYDVDLISYNTPEKGWLWTSTEVEENPTNQAWLFSMFSGTMQETPKTQEHPSRLIMNYYQFTNQ